MKNDIHHLYQPYSPLSAPADLSRRRFIKQSAALAAASPLAGGLSLSLPSLAAGSPLSASKRHLAANPLGFNGERQDPTTGLYPLGKGYRVYHPTMMRFHASDSLSPFGQGGINAYAYSLGDPINLRDPSGHFAFASLLVGAIVGAGIGAAISAVATGGQAVVTHSRFDWKTVAIGSALGFISGCVGNAMTTVGKASAQVGLVAFDTVLHGGADFGCNVATGANMKQVWINTGIDAVIGLATFGVGMGVGKAWQFLNANRKGFARIRPTKFTWRAGSEVVNQAFGSEGSLGGPITHLPNELLERIAGYLPAKDLCRFSQASSKMFSISKSCKQKPWFLYQRFYKPVYDSVLDEIPVAAHKMIIRLLSRSADNTELGVKAFTNYNRVYFDILDEDCKIPMRIIMRMI